MALISNLLKPDLNKKHKNISIVIGLIEIFFIVYLIIDMVK